MGRRENETSVNGWTNYTSCFPTQAQVLLMKVYDNNNIEDAQTKFEVAQNTRYLEFAGFTLSLAALLVSLSVFHAYRCLRNIRTRIHQGLFIAISIQVVIRLMIYIDQALIRKYAWYTGFEDIAPVCISLYILLETAINSMFTWMLIEGLYLYKVVIANTLRTTVNFRLYNIIGWGAPVFVTSVWATCTAAYYNKEPTDICWYGYNFQPLFWIVQGPRLAVIVVNMIFLICIMRSLIIKLQQQACNELQTVRKATRAALVLLPLLGITNVLSLVDAPLDHRVGFAVWSYVSHVLRSFQGFFIALTYCFLNGEVREVLVRSYMAAHEQVNRSRQNRPQDRSNLYHFRFTDRGREGTTAQFVFGAAPEEPRESRCTPGRWWRLFVNWVATVCSSCCKNSVDMTESAEHRADEDSMTNVSPSAANGDDAGAGPSTSDRPVQQVDWDETSLSSSSSSFVAAGGHRNLRTIPGTPPPSRQHLLFRPPMRPARPCAFPRVVRPRNRSDSLPLAVFVPRPLGLARPTVPPPPPAAGPSDAAAAAAANARAENCGLYYIDDELDDEVFLPGA
ncbi:PDF receptor isoform X2 [Plutella xylostella]|uniref:PDF receptor isoform X2 n=1 Tax=Plutella xylostella TaxID=51655 RepID=UPI0020324F1A|nr:PDF receptor isoform X2 [Plutella xylostella]